MVEPEVRLALDVDRVGAVRAAVGLSVQLFPTIFRLRMITLDERDRSTLPSISAPHRPQMVLFEPTLDVPEILPDT